MGKLSRNEMRKRRHRRIRKKVVGTPARPRLCVYKSLRHIYAQ
ncbi:50S ribosomal protein L18, partial [Candidatus Bipolaricaulota bacterium]|nr:50S ribosomal protein L18 [Candidatus Bipolaricaulota bacterium]